MVIVCKVCGEFFAYCKGLHPQKGGVKKGEKRPVGCSVLGCFFACQGFCLDPNR